MNVRWIAVLLLAAGCRGQAKGPPDTAVETRSYPLVGVVRALEPDSGRVVVKHEEIAGFMPSMTMPLAVSDKSLLTKLRPGDKISATLKVTGDHSELEDVEVTEAAEPPAMVLDLSGPSPSLREKTGPIEPGQSVPDFTMTTQDGKPLKLSDLRGEVVALTFIYTRCPLPDYCPRMDTSFAEVARMVAVVPSRVGRVRLLSVSFDPEHDTPEVLKKHAAFRGAKPPLWTFAVATHEELRKVMEPLGLVYGPRRDDVVHNLSTSVIGPDGRLVKRFEGSRWTPGDVFKVIREAMPR
jgi:protein SCO1/2